LGIAEAVYSKTRTASSVTGAVHGALGGASDPSADRLK
jgi:hypothetical protein